MPELDASFVVGGAKGHESHDLETEDLAAQFDIISYTEVDTGQKEEFQFLLSRVC